MNAYFLGWLTFVAVFVPAIISPGPDFFVVVQNALKYSRRVGLFTALGLGGGVLVHLVYTYLGFAALMAQSVFIFNLIKWLGAAYLVYIGLQALRSKGVTKAIMRAKIAASKQGLEHKAPQHISAFAALRTGFLTNVLNPKAAVFFLAVVAQVAGPDTPFIWKIVQASTGVFITVVWFSFVAFVLTGARARAIFTRWSMWIERITGGILILLGLKIALTQKTDP